MMKKVFIAFASILSFAFVSCSDLTTSGGGSGSFFDKWWRLMEVYTEEAGRWSDDPAAYGIYYRFGSDGIATVYDGDMTEEYPFTYDSKTHTITPAESGEPAVVSIVSGELIIDLQDGYGTKYKCVQESPFGTPVVPDDPDDEPDVPSVSGIVGKWQIYQFDYGDGWFDAEEGDVFITEFTVSGAMYAYEDGLVSDEGRYTYYESTNILEMSYDIGGQSNIEYYTVVSLTSSEMILAYVADGYTYRIKLRRI